MALGVKQAYSAVFHMHCITVALVTIGLVLKQCVCVCLLVTQSCPSLCNPIDCSLLSSFAYGILQAKIIE